MKSRHYRLITVGLMAGLLGQGEAQYGPVVADVDSFQASLSSYVGAQACAECHADAYDVWLGTPHARSWVFLATPMAHEIASRFTPPVEDPAWSARCLSCHATAATVDPAHLSTDFHYEEGVQCEACHGPGADHAADPVVPTFGSELISQSQDGTTCNACHRPPPSHVILDRKPFDRSRGLRRIDHMPPDDGSSATRSGSRIGRLLRSMIGR